MQELWLMSGTGTVPKQMNDDVTINSIRLIRLLRYEPMVIPADELRAAILSASRERRAKEREATLDRKTE